MYSAQTSSNHVDPTIQTEIADGLMLCGVKSLGGARHIYVNTEKINHHAGFLSVGVGDIVHVFTDDRMERTKRVVEPGTLRKVARAMGLTIPSYSPTISKNLKRSPGSI